MEPLNRSLPDPGYMRGVWEIIDCGLETAKGDSRGVLGTVFELTANGEVLWKLPRDRIDIPLFSTEIYEIVTRGPYLTSLLRFGSYKGHIIEFRIERFDIDANTILAHDGLFYMTCKKQRVAREHMIELPFTLLPALEEGYFSDLSIFASNRREFRVHTSILKLTAPELDWTDESNPLSGLPSDLLAPILHFMYTQSLPEDITEFRVEQILAVASNCPGLEGLVSICQAFMRNSSLKQVMLTILSDLYKCGIQVMENFTCLGPVGPLITDPVMICSAVKNSLREIALAGAKVLLFCDLYNKRKDEFSIKAAHEIIRFTKTRIPVFVSQAETFLHTVRETFTTLKPPQRSSLAYYLLPEMENIFDILLTLLVKARSFLEGVLYNYGPVDEERFRVQMNSLKAHMDRAHKKKEIAKIQFILQRLDGIVSHLHKKRESFRCMTNANQARCMSRNLDHLLEKLPFFLMRLEEIAGDLDDKLDWNESLFCFKIGTTKVGEVLNTLLENKDYFEDLLIGMCELIERDEFTQIAVALGLLDESHDIANASGRSEPHIFENEKTFNLTECLLAIPPPRRNALCKAALQRLRKAEDTDMVFKIMTPEDAESDTEEIESDDETTEGESLEDAMEEDAAAGMAEGAAAAMAEGAAAGMAEGAAAAMAEGAAAAMAGSAAAAMAGSAAAAMAEGAAAAMAEGAAAAMGASAAAATILGGGTIMKRKLRKELDYTRIKCLRLTATAIMGSSVGGANSSETEETEEVTEKGSDEAIEQKQEIENNCVKIRAHRVIVATRCDWFRKALLSGMQEDINRQIEIHAIRPSLFLKLLDFLYSGVLDYSSLTGMQLSRLILLADCFELDSFKIACERAMRTFINDDSVLALLNLSDDFHAEYLKTACLTYITNYPGVTLDCTFIEELPPHLRIQIYDMVIWGKHLEMFSLNSPINIPRRVRRPLPRNFQIGIGFAQANNGNAQAGNGNAQANNGNEQADIGNGQADNGNAQADIGNGQVDIGNGLADNGNAQAEGGEASRSEPERSQDISPSEESILIQSLIDELCEMVGSGATRSLHK